ncbi:MAG: hypothetical protein AB1762_15910, partial [Gemmatimonadota bacterium]
MPSTLTVQGGQSAQFTIVGTGLTGLTLLQVVSPGTNTTITGASATFISSGDTQRRISIAATTTLVSGQATVRGRRANGTWEVFPVAIITVAAPNDAAITITSLTLNPSTVYVGAQVTAAVTLSAAPVASLAVDIVNEATGTVITSGTFTPGSTSLNLPFTAQGGGTLRAQRPPYSTGPTASLTAHPQPAISQLSLGGTSQLHAGVSKTLIVVLSPSAALGGVLLLSTTSSAIFIPTTVPLTNGQSMVQITVGVANAPQSSSGTIIASIGSSQKTFHFQLIGSASTVAISSITPAADSVTGGSNATFTASLSAAAPAGTTLKVTSSGPVVVAPPNGVTVGPAATSAQVTVTTIPVTMATTAQITVESGTSAKTMSLTVLPPKVAGLTFTPPYVAGQPVSGKVTLDGLVAAAPGLTANLTSSDPAVAQPPASVTVLPGSFEQTFTMTTTAAFASNSKSVTISAQSAGGSESASLSFTRQTGVVSAVSFAPATVDAGGNATGTVTLDKPSKAGGTVVQLTSANSVVQVPASVTVAGGQSTQTFSATTASVTANTNVAVSATDGLATKSGTLAVRLPLALASIAVASAVEGGQSAQVSVAMNRSLQSGESKTVSLSSSGNMQLPSTVTLTCCLASTPVTATTALVSSDQSVIVTATLDGVTRSDTVLVRPPAVVTAVDATPDSLWGGQSGSLTIQLNRPALQATVVALSSSDPSRVTVAPSATISGGQTLSIPITTTSGPAAAFTLAAALNGSSAQTGLTLLSFLPTLAISIPGLPGRDTLAANTTYSANLTLGGKAPAAFTVT